MPESTLKLYVDNALFYIEIHSPEDSKFYKKILTDHRIEPNAG